METRTMDSWAKGILQRIGTVDALRAARKKHYSIGTIRFPKTVASFWDGGSRSYYTFYQPSTGRSVNLPENHPVFEPGRPYYLKALPPDCILVETGIFCGKPMAARFCMPEQLAIA